MLEKLNTYSPLAVLALLVMNVYLVVALNEAQRSVRDGSHQALNAANNAGTAAIRCSDCGGMRGKLDLVLARCSKCSTCGPGSSSRPTPTTGSSFYQTYNEVLLEDVARKLNVDQVWPRPGSRRRTM